MKRGSTVFLRLAVGAIGAIVAALCVFALPAMWMEASKGHTDVPHAIYGIVVVMYGTAAPFFVALYEALRLLKYVDTGKAFSELAVTSLKRITICAVAISAIYAASLPLFYIWADSDDAPGLVIIGLVLTCAPLAVGVFAAVLRRLFQEAMTIKSENDLTV